MFHVAQGRWENVERLTILHRAYLIPGYSFLQQTQSPKIPFNIHPNKIFAENLKFHAIKNVYVLYF